jgi:aminoglycoside 3-N-acetyltransferase
MNISFPCFKEALTVMHTYTKEELLHQLAAMGAPRDSVVLMHSSLRAIGPVEGGAQALLDALIEYFTGHGGLFCVPTHTWHNLKKDITMDMCSDESCLGAFAGIAIRDPRGIRSENPCHSMVVFGDREKAQAFVEGELDVPSPTAPSSCYGKLFAMGGQILLVGVAHNRNTCLHTVDEMLELPNRMADSLIPVAVKKPDGQIIRRQLRLFHTDYTSDISYRFVKYETAFRYHRCITDGFLGNAPTQLCDAQKMLDTIRLIYQNCGSADPLAGESPIPQKWYCTK